MSYDRAVEETKRRLEEVDRDHEWTYTENFIVYGGTLWLQFAAAWERRMYWVRVDDERDNVRMTWDLSEVPDLV